MKSTIKSSQYSLSLKHIRGIYGVFLVAIGCIIIHPRCTVLSLETKVKGFYFQKEQTGAILGVEHGMQTSGNMSNTYVEMNIREN